MLWTIPFSFMFKIIFTEDNVGKDKTSGKSHTKLRFYDLRLLICATMFIFFILLSKKRQFHQLWKWTPKFTIYNQTIIVLSVCFVGTIITWTGIVHISHALFHYIRCLLKNSRDVWESTKQQILIAKNFRISNIRLGIDRIFIFSYIIINFWSQNLFSSQ